MTPAEFAATYRPTALEVKAGTGIDDTVLLAQWANETAWGQAVFGNNLGNIRCSPTSFCQYATLSDFAASAIGVFHQPNFAAVLASTKGTPQQQLAAIVASPWDSGHYGGSLAAFYDPLEALPMPLDINDPVVKDIINGISDCFKAIGIDPTQPGFKSVAARLDALEAGGGVISLPQPITVAVTGSFTGNATGAVGSVPPGT